MKDMNMNGITPEDKAEELIDVFLNDNTRDSERKAIKHSIFHVEEILNFVEYLDDHEFYNKVLTILKDKQ